MKRYGKMVMGFMLWSLMMLGYVCTARAATDTYKHLIPANADSDEKLAGKQVTFNGYKWYIIEDHSTDAGTVTLFAVDPIGISQFNEKSNDGNQYNNSTVQKYLYQLTEGGYSFGGVADAIDETDLDDVGVSHVKLYLLSEGEAENLPGGSKVRSCVQASGSYNNHWWLRTPTYYMMGYAKAIYGVGGEVSEGNIVDYPFGVRPALKLDLSKVHFITVNLSGGKNATASGGSSVQKLFFLNNSASGSMTTVNYTANTGYHFEEFTATIQNGITVERTNETTVTVSGRPTDNESITIPDAVVNTYTVTLDNQGATTTGTDQVTATYNEVLPGIADNLPAKDDAVFDGYFNEINGGGTQYLKADGTPTDARWTTDGPGTLYAKWIAEPPAAITEKPTANKHIYNDKPETSPSLDHEKEPAGTSFKKLQPRITKLTENSLRVQWKRINKARKYVVYGNACGRKNRMKKLTVVTGTSITFKKVAGRKVRKGTYYKFFVQALDQKNRFVSRSPVVHAATKGGKFGNYKNVIVTAKVGKKKKTVKKVSIKPGEIHKTQGKAETGKQETESQKACWSAL